jgi:uncharacterized membrane protein YkoI
MVRSSAPRRFLVPAFALSLGAGIGLGAAGAASAWGADATQAPHVGTVAAAAAMDAPVPAGTPASSPLTVDEAKTVATQASPGRVVEVDTDDEANDPTEVNDPAEADDPAEANEPTGLRYDVTVLHDDGTTTKVEVDAATGRVVSTELDDD